MDQPLETRTLSDYLRVLKARRRLIVTTTLVAAGAALVFSLAQPPKYEATATVNFTSQFFQQAGSQPLTPGQTVTPGTAAGIKLITRQDVVNRASKAMDGDPTPDELRTQVTAALEPSSNLVDITAQGESGDQAAEIANQFAAQTEAVAQAETGPNFGVKGRITNPVEIVRQADVPSSPASPKPLQNTVIAGFLGLIVGIGLAFLRQALDRRVEDPHQIQRSLGLPLVGYVHADSLGMAGMSLNGDTSVLDEDLETFRIIRANVDFLGGDEGLKTVAVTSPLPEEGKSTVSAGFAYANALAGRRTLLVECDFRRPVLAERFGLDPSPGLMDHLLGEAKPSDVLRSVDVEGPAAEPLPVIPAGTDAPQPAEMIASPRFSRFLTQVAKAYDLVVIDCAPLLPVGDALELLPLVDGVLLCIRIGQTTREQATAAKDAMEHFPDKPTGLVCTGLERGGEEDYYGYYSHGAAEPGGAASRA